MAQIQPIAAPLLFQLEHGIAEAAQALLLISPGCLLQTQPLWVPGLGRKLLADHAASAGDLLPGHMTQGFTALVGAQSDQLIAATYRT